jgi:hypothetical protein
MARILRLAGAISVILSLWLPWYAIHLPANFQSVIDAQAGQMPPAFSAIARGLLAAMPRDLQVSGWEVFTGADVAMALLSAGVILLCLIAADRSASVLTAAALAILVLYHVIDRPGPTGFATPEEGALLGLAGATLVLLGTYLDREPVAVMVAAAGPLPPASAPPPR